MLNFDLIKGAIYGGAVGDALGIPVECRTRTDVRNTRFIKIEKEYQGKHILKNMIKNVFINTNNTYSKVYATINNDNTKLKEVFTHIGFKNIKGIL